MHPPGCSDTPSAGSKVVQKFLCNFLQGIFRASALLWSGKAQQRVCRRHMPVIFTRYIFDCNKEVQQKTKRIQAPPPRCCRQTLCRGSHAGLEMKEGMLRSFPQPVVLVSRCLGFDNCRYDGQQLRAEIVELLQGYVQFIDICPEVAAGLGVPRAPIRLCVQKEAVEVWQPAESRTVTRQLEMAAAEVLPLFLACDGAVLKSKSPSCGLYDAKVFHGREQPQFLRRGSGMLGEKILAAAANRAVDDEMRLSNLAIREHFLIKLYASARFREIDATRKMRDLISFHASYKFLFLAYNEKHFRRCGRIVANHEKLGQEEVFTRYRAEMALLLQRPFRREAMVNTLYHAYGLIAEGLAAEEKEYIINTIEEYRDERIPLQAVTRLLEGQALRFDQHYLRNQALLQPFPTELSLLTDSGKGRKVQ